MTRAFLAAGYTVETFGNAVKTAISDLKLDLPAHGTGNSDSGTQGDLQQEAANWVVKLTAWAAAHPPGFGSQKASGKQHNEEQRQAFAKSKVAKKNEKQSAKASAHKEEVRAKCFHPPNKVVGGFCVLCGQEV